MIIIFFRAIFLYIIIIIGLRIMGKRQIGELQPSELVITIMVSNIATLPIEDTNIPMIMGAIPILALVSFEVILSNLTLKSRKLREIVSGHPIVIIKNGVIDQKMMRELRFSIDDLMESLRESSVFDLNDVNYAVVETTGKVSVLQKVNAMPPTAKMLDIKQSETSPPEVIVSDGKFVKSGFSRLNLGESWANEILKSERLLLKSVYLMTADKNGKYLIVPRQQKNSPQNIVRQA